MAASWHDVLRKIGIHTLCNAAAMGSFVILVLLSKWGIQDVTLRAILDDIEGIVLIVLVVVFALQVIYDVLPEKIRDFIASKFVFA